jgi:hypothetical protein
MVSVGCGPADEDEEVAVFDACQPLQLITPNASAAELASIDEAAAMWHALGVLAPPREAADAGVPITFDKGPPFLYGIYDGTKISINLLLEDEPRAIVIAHEVGHALGLLHVPIEERHSVMNPGNLTIAPTAEDRDAIFTLWGACP